MEILHTVVEPWGPEGQREKEITRWLLGSVFKTQRWAIFFLVRYGKEVTARESTGRLWKNLSLLRGSGVKPESCLPWELTGVTIAACIYMAFCFFHSVCSLCTNAMLHVGKGHTAACEPEDRLD